VNSTYMTTEEAVEEIHRLRRSVLRLYLCLEEQRRGLVGVWEEATTELTKAVTAMEGLQLFFETVVETSPQTETEPPRPLRVLRPEPGPFAGGPES
jgi:hypothetical protein